MNGRNDHLLPIALHTNTEPQSLDNTSSVDEKILSSNGSSPTFPRSQAASSVVKSTSLPWPVRPSFIRTLKSSQDIETRRCNWEIASALRKRRVVRFESSQSDNED